MNESGSTLRFMIPLCLTVGASCRLYGKPRLFERPLGIYEEICREQGILWERSSCELKIHGTLTAGEFTVPGNVSSQFISGLLFALPLLPADSVIRITNTFESVSYVRMTLQTLQEHGVEVEFDGKDTLRIPGGQRYRAGTYAVEGDYSNAAFFEAFRVLGHKLTVTGLAPQSLQGDQVYLDYFPRLAVGAPTLSIGDCPDLAPVLMAVAAEKHGCILTETARLKIKESDRGAVMAEELSKFGAEVLCEDDRIIIQKTTLRAPTVPLMSHGDHRIVMALSVLAAKYGGEIYGAEDVKKSFPDFFRAISALGAKVELYEAE